VINTVSAATSQLQQNAKSMSSTASETDRQSKLVQDASEQAIANVRTVADVAEQLSKSINESGSRSAPPPSGVRSRRSPEPAPSQAAYVRTGAKPLEFGSSSPDSCQRDRGLTTVKLGRVEMWRGGFRWNISVVRLFRPAVP
jgi:hypothetical protein